MHSNDIFTKISHQFHANNVNTNIFVLWKKKHETLLLITIIDRFCP